MCLVRLGWQLLLESPALLAWPAALAVAATLTGPSTTLLPIAIVRVTLTGIPIRGRCRVVAAALACWLCARTHASLCSPLLCSCVLLATGLALGC